MNDFLAQVYYGNTIQAWLISLTIIILSTRLARAGDWLILNSFKKLTAKTKTNFDDMLVTIIEKPLFMFLVMLGIWFGLSLLVLPAKLDIFIRDLVDLLVTMLLAWFLVRVLDLLIEQYIRPLIRNSDSALGDQLLPLLQKTGKLVIWAVAIILGLKHAGYDVGALLAGLGIGGIAVAMAAKDTIANIFGGFTILADRPFHLNDRIKIVGFDGVVKEIGVRSTRLETLEGRTVTIPNSKFAESPVENVSMEPARKITLELGLSYATTPQQMDQALAVLRDIATGHADVEKTISLCFSGFGASALNITFVYYIRRGADIASTQSTINLVILKRFSEAKLQFAVPA
jgi:MscS family membrane protein